MKVAIQRLIALCIPFLIAACTSSMQQATMTEERQAVQPPASISSPDGMNRIDFELRDGVPTYSVRHGEKEVILPSKLGIIFANLPPLVNEFTLSDVSFDTVDYMWTQPWGEVAEIRDHYAGMTVELTNSNGMSMTLQLRAYDDGIAFRYELPEQNVMKNVKTAEIRDEVTEFALAGNPEAWSIPAYQWNRYEYLYTKSPVSELDTVHTPVTLETQDGLFLCIHEAALTNYASMTLAHREGDLLKCDLVPWSDGIKVRGPLPMVSPWRIVMIADSAAGLLTSTLELNCNEPCRIEDTSWIKPGKYVGIWWGMHLGIETWSSGDRHGATTENTKRYIDFASKYGFNGVLVEGWNVGWDGDWGANGDKFSFTQPYPDYDLTGLAAYAREKGVRLIAHNETSTGILNYETQLDSAFALYHRLGINTVKSGYVGQSREIKRRDPATGEVIGLEWHHGQYMVEHYRKVVETAAKYHLMIDAHEPIHDTGIRRTWPNMMTREGARGQEYNAWSGDGGNPPDYTTIIPFTRLLAGPMDFTPGIFDLIPKKTTHPKNRVNTTLAKQLALYVVIYSPLQMAADLPENYGGQPAFKFIEDVSTDWAKTVALNGVIGDYVTIARKDRHSDDWYLGSITDENGRTLIVPLNFLNEGVTYTAEIYADGEGCDWKTNPLAISITTRMVTSDDSLEIVLAPGGGRAIRFSPIEKAAGE
ncbi:MAG: glycoside hydrolase family 97 protein [bacterium]